MFKTAAIKNEKDVLNTSKTNYAQKSDDVNLYAQLVDKGGWIRIPQKDGTLKFKWDNEISNQQDVDEKYQHKNASYLGRYFKVNGQNGKNYALQPNGKANVIEQKMVNGTLSYVPVKTVDAIEIIGVNYSPIAVSSIFDEEVAGCTYSDCDFGVEVKYSMANLTTEEKRNVRIIQVLYSEEAPHKPRNGKKLGQIDGELAFVDGGINAAKEGRTTPWYAYGDDDQKGKFPGMKRNYRSNTFRFELSDNPASITNYKSVHFESYIVIDNYHGSGKIKILSVVKWGFNHDGGQITKTIENPQTIYTDQFSAKAQEIWDNDYGDSKHKIFK